MTNDYDSSVRRMLVDTVEATKLVTAPARRRSLLIGALAFVLSGAVTGGAVSAIAVGSAERDEKPAFVVGSPSSTIGTNTYDLLGETLVRSGSGDETLDLSDRPGDATGILVEFQCSSPGKFTWLPVGFVREGSLSLTCREKQLVGPQRGAATTVFDLESSTDAFAVTATGDATWELSITWVRPRPVEWRTNDNGDTYGIEDWDGARPVLLLRFGTNGNGRTVEGYVRSVDFTTATGRYDNDASYSVDLPLFASDGETQIGTYRVGD